MKVVFLTPGTGGWYCGACIRDHVLAKALRVAGHDALMVPMYLPLHLDEEMIPENHGRPVRFGGINLYLQGRYPWFSRAPQWLRRGLDHPSLLRTASRFGHLTSAAALGSTTLSMLRMDGGGMREELHQLCDWLAGEKPDVVCLSTALQAGMIPMLKATTGAKILCGFQGEDGFLDGLPAEWSSACWSEMANAVTQADLRTAPSAFYAGFMEMRLGQTGTIGVLPNGVDVSAFHPVSDPLQPPVIGYLARLCAAKGVDVMVEAFLRLRAHSEGVAARLHLAGTTTPEDLPVIKALKQRIAAAGLESSVTWSPGISHSEKVAMLGGLSLFSVPVRVPEAFGLYAIEAMASGVPLVLPDASAFPEILADSGSGVLVAPGDPDALADAWRSLLERPQDMAEMARRGRAAAEQHHNAALMAERFLAIVR